MSDKLKIRGNLMKEKTPKGQATGLSKVLRVKEDVIMCNLDCKIMSIKFGERARE